jgi:vacuolar-type H+-ATPase subunit E/Vma4
MKEEIKNVIENSDLYSDLLKSGVNTLLDKNLTEYVDELSKELESDLWLEGLEDLITDIHYMRNQYKSGKITQSEESRDEIIEQIDNLRRS